MDPVEHYREIVEQVLQRHSSYTSSGEDIATHLVADREHGEYLLVDFGWAPEGRLHSVFGHVRLQDGKVWIEKDGTEKGFAVEFVEAGIPKEDIVLAFYRPERRKLTDFAVA